MRIGGRAAANETGLAGDEAQMPLVAQPRRLQRDRRSGRPKRDDSGVRGLASGWRRRAVASPSGQRIVQGRHGDSGFPRGQRRRGERTRRRFARSASRRTKRARLSAVAGFGLRFHLAIGGKLRKASGEAFLHARGVRS